MIINIILLVVGFIILVKGADIFVSGSSSVAKIFNVSKMVIGLTIVAFGTSAPEFAVSIKSMLAGTTDMLIGNVIGSNILNILLILGISAMIYPIKIQNATIKKEIPIMILMSVLLGTLFLDSLYNKDAVNIISRGDGITILLFFLVFIYYLFSIMRKKIDDKDEEQPMSLFKSIVFITLGLVSLIIGSSLAIDSASNIAEILGVSERMISLTVIALGTSLPELITSIVAAKKRETDILVGNIIGSNIFNIGIVLGLPVAIFGGVPGGGFTNIDLIVMIAATILLFVMSYKDHRICKKEGIMLLIVFGIYYLYIIGGN